jgi:hypothetical protein
LAVYSFVRALVSGRREEILILSFIIPFFIVVGGSKFLVYARYMIPLMPFLYILCARYLVQLRDSLQLKQRLATGVLVIASILLLIQPALNVAEYEREISGKSTRILAKDWIEANIPFGSKILMDSGKSINTNGPRIAENRESIIRILERSRRAVEKRDRVRTRGLVNRHALLYYELLLKTVPENSYDITYTMFGMEVGSIDYYISNQYQYFIISKGMKGRGKNEYFKQRYPKIAGFYNSLDTDNRIELIKTIGPTRSNTGPTFYVYKLPSAL